MIKKLLGKKPVRIDKRTLRLGNYLKLVAPPPSFDVDTSLGLGVIANPMFANDQIGDCVMVTRAHMTLRFEGFEQKKIIAIADQEVEKEYFLETGGQDIGLDTLASLTKWKKSGWTVGGKILNIDMFGSVDPTKPDEVKACISLLRGIQTGLQLPDNWHDAVAPDDPTKWTPWKDVSLPANPNNGHMVYVKKYDAQYLQCVTWGAVQLMTWAFFQKYSDEDYGVVDNKDIFIANDTLDVAGMEKELAAIAQTPPAPGPTPAPTPPPAPTVITRIRLAKSKDAGKTWQVLWENNV